MASTAPSAPRGVDRDLVVRPKRQVTLPVWVCDELGIEVGDRLMISVTDAGLLLRPGADAALDALREIRAAFDAAGVHEDELQRAGRDVRAELAAAKRGAGDESA